LRRLINCILGLAFIFFVCTTKTFADDQAYFLLENPTQAEWSELPNNYNSVVVEFISGDEFVDIKFNSDDQFKRLTPNYKDDETVFSEMIFFELSKSVWINYPGEVNLHFYNSTIKKPTLLAGSLYIGDLKIVSRSEWGADETIRYRYDEDKKTSTTTKPSMSQKVKRCEEIIKKHPNEYVYDRVVANENDNNLIWPRQYSKKIQKIVVHHTAESEKSASIPGGDKIRSIYYYHAKTKGWGDIGYNFVIDQDGKIYEGRAGGDYVVGGHVYCSNVNTIGISLMGNFMRDQPTKNQVSSLAKLINALARKYNLNVGGNNTFHGESKSTLLGHRDLGATSCPGDNLYNVLPLLRKHFSVSGKKLGIIKERSIAPASAYSAQLTGNPTIFEMPAINSKEVIIKYKNTGSVDWKKGTWLYVANNDNNKFWARDQMCYGQNGEFKIVKYRHPNSPTEKVIGLFIWDTKKKMHYYIADFGGTVKVKQPDGTVYTKEFLEGPDGKVDVYGQDIRDLQNREELVKQMINEVYKKMPVWSDRCE